MAGERGLRAMDAVRQAVERLPVPTSRPAFRRADEERGLALLDLALRLDHVTRFTENLRLVDSGHLERSVEVDVDLRHLTRRQRQALAARRPQVVPDPPPDGDDHPPEQATPADDGSRLDGTAENLWIPLSRYNRHHVAPMQVSDQTGTIRHRLTADATAESVIAGMARILRSQISSRAAASRSHRHEDVLPVRSRWLVEHAMAHVIRNGYASRPDPMPDGTPFRTNPRGDRERRGEVEAAARLRADVADVRERAVAYLEALEPDVAEAFDWLLDTVAQEAFVVVMLPADGTLCHLRYDAPTIPAQPLRESVGRRLLRLLWDARDLTVSYRTQLPRNARSYHLTVTVPEGLDVRRFLFVTDVDGGTVARLSDDLHRLARSYERPGPAAAAVLGTRLVDVLARVSALARRRSLQVSAYESYLARLFRRFDDRPDLPPPRALPLDVLLADLAARRCSLDHLTSLAHHHEQGRLTTLGHLAPAALSEALRTLAHYLTEAELHRDLVVDNDPREHGAHAYWNSSPRPPGQRSSAPVNARVHLTVADETPAFVENVSRMLLALLSVVLLIKVLHRVGAGGSGALPQADAVVAVLLLVPSILVSRLDIPTTHSVLGVVRGYPRRLAYLSVAVTSVLAVVVAVEDRDVGSWLTGGSVVLAALAALCGLLVLARALRRRSPAPRCVTTPRWLLEAAGIRRDRPRQYTDVHFDAIDGTSHDSAAGATRRADGSLDGLGSPGPRLGDRARPWWARLLHRARRAVDLPWRRPRRTPAMLLEGRAHPAVQDVGRPVEEVTFTSRAAYERITGVAFTVTHRMPSDDVPDIAGDFLTPRTRRGSESLRAASGIFAFTAYGTGCEVSTELVSEPAVFESSTFIARRDAPQSRPGWSHIHGVALVGSRHAGRSAEVGEVLLQLGTEPDLRLRHSLALGHVLAELGRLLVETGAVAVAVHAPASGHDVQRAGEPPRVGRTVGPFVRVRLSAGPEHAAARVAFETRLCALAADLGLGVHLSAGRHGFSTGSWHPAVEFSAERFAAACLALVPQPGGLPEQPDQSEQPAEQVMLTLVGPATDATTAELAGLARTLTRLGIGVHVASTWQTNQASFQHLVLARAATRTEVALDDATRDPLGFLVAECATVPDAAAVAQDLAWPAEHAVVLADVAPLLPRRPDGGTVVVPLWLTWELPHGAVGVDTLQRHVLAAFAAMGHPHAWTSVVRARRTSTDRSAGRARFSVEVPADILARQDHERLGILAKRVQEEVVNRLIASCDVAPFAINLHVAWNERWLNHPTTW